MKNAKTQVCQLRPHHSKSTLEYLWCHRQASLKVWTVMKFGTNYQVGSQKSDARSPKGDGVNCKISKKINE